MFDKLEEVVVKFKNLEQELAKPEIYDDQKKLKELTSERSYLEPIVNKYFEYKKVKDDIEGAKDILKSENDEEMREMAKEELTENEAQIQSLTEELQILLLPKDPLDEKDVIIEIRAGAGGDEASIFAADVLRMYSNYLKTNNFKIDMISASENDKGFKEVIFSVKGESPYSKLKYESGVHRVQRVPKTESQGRVHTSTITVAVLAEADEVDLVIDPNDLRIDVYRSGGAGGQSVNTTDSAVRITHIPTGTVVAMQDERSQHKNKDKAMRILKSRIYDQMQRQKKEAEDANRKGQVGTGDRSERIRTYNFPQGRLTDHRIGLTLYSLDKIIEGELDQVFDSLQTYFQAEMLKGSSE